MKLICKKTGPTKDRFKLTIDKEYNSIAHYFNRYDDNIIQSYKVINDDGRECLYDESMFYSVEEMRNKKLENLGI